MTESIKVMAFGCLGALLLTGAGTSASGADKASGPARDEFKDIVVYNIFDPDRGPRPEPKPKAPVKQDPPPPKVERLTLTGVLKSDHGAYGFFDGTDRDFQKVGKPGDQVGVFKVIKIGIDSADLGAGTNHFVLRIGGELSRTGEEPWKVSGTTSFSGSGAAPASASASSAGASDPADEERRKKLLELLKKKRESGK
ncbi:MAG: hypothetical protein ISQ14_01240 [Verrucomicrobiae bacterium]|jgi:hypothetical protein|nr:hypothetical protein [Verrucomicrobiae bacterium]